MSDIRGVVFFDLDDTLFDLTSFHNDAIKLGFNASIEKGFNLKSLEELCGMYKDFYNKNKTARDHYEDVFNAVYGDNIERENHIEIARRAYLSKIDDIKNYIFPKVIESLERLRDEKYILGIISQGDPNFQREKLGLIGLESLFEENLIELHTSKSEELYRNIIENVRSLSSNVWMIGDRENSDIIMSRSAGFKVVRFRHESGKYFDKKDDHDYPEFDSFEECVDYLIKNG